MKHFQSFFKLLILIMSIVCPMTIHADTISDGNLRYSIDTETMTAVVTGLYNYNIREVVIPDKIEYKGTQYPVSEIGESAFKSCRALTSLTIGNSVTSIGYSAFFGCSGLTSLTIGNSVTEIGDFAFWGCSGLTSLSIPNSVTKIGNEAFYDCVGLASLTIPNSVTEISYRAFYNCSGIKELTISDGTENLNLEQNVFYDVKPETIYLGRNITSYYNDFSFSDDKELTKLTFGDSVTSIGYSAFSGCSGLTSLTIGNSVTEIGTKAFYGCSALTSVTIPESIINVHDAAFYNCDNLETIYFNAISCVECGDEYDDIWLKGYNNVVPAYMGNPYPHSVFPKNVKNIIFGDKVSKIPRFLCYDLNNITSLTIPDSVTEIGSYAFYGSGIKDIVMADGTENIYFWENAISGISLETLYLGRNFTGTSYYTPFKNITTLAKLTIGNSVTKIGDSAFQGCIGLTSLTIPDSVTEIGSSAFESCSALTSLTIGNSVTSIGSSAFSGCSALTSLTVGNSVTSIGASAFSGCSAITSLTIGNSVTSIGYSAFSGCSVLTSLTIGNSVTSIGAFAFSGCSALTSLTIGNSVTSIGASAFSGCSGLTLLTIPNSVTGIGASAFKGCSGLTSLSISNSVTKIGTEAFSGCNGITSLTIPNSVTEISYRAFYNCSSIKELIMSDGTENLNFEQDVFYDVAPETIYLGRNISCDSSPFSSNNRLTKLTIGADVTEIGYRAFYNCRGIKELTICDGSENLNLGNQTFYYVAPETLYLGRNITSDYGLPFSNNNVLKKLTIGNSVTEIYSYSFSGCSGLTSLTIPNFVTSIGDYSFSGCSAITSLTIGNSVTSIGSSAFERCSGITSLTIPNSVKKIGAYAFSGCSAITSLTIGNSVTSIGDYSFSGCSGLTSLTIPNFVTSIGDSAFYGCSAIKDLTFGDSSDNLVLGRDVFYGVTPETLYLGRNITSDYGLPFTYCKVLSKLTIGRSVTEIGEIAFFDSTIETIESYASIAPKIYQDSFSASTKFSCPVSIPDSALESYQKEWWMFKVFHTDVVAENTYRVSSPGNLMNQLPLDKVEEITSLKLIGEINGTDLLVLNRCSNIVDLDLSEATIVSGGMPYYEKDNERFGTENNILNQMWSYNMVKLTWLKLPETLSEIGEKALSGKTRLLEMVIPKSVTEIGRSAFSGCRSLTAMIIPNTVDSIRLETFANCSELKDVRIEDDSRPIGIMYNAFYNTNIEKLYLGRSVSDCSWNLYNNRETLKTVVIGETVTEIEGYIFSSCSNIEKAEFASIESLCGIRFLGETSNPLYYAKHLWIAGEEIKDVVIPASVTSVGDYTFVNCIGLTSVSIPETVTSVGKRAFYGCSALTSVILPNSLQEIGEGAFERCSSLHSINIPDPVQKIEGNTFMYCDALESIVLPGSIREIGPYAFCDCSSLVMVKVINPIPPVIESSTFTSAASATLTVPEGSRVIYWIHPYWSKFATVNTWGGVDSEMPLFAVDNISYRVTSENDNTVEVVSATVVERKSDIELPETVEYNGKVYRVAGIANNGFENVAVSSITLPSTIGYVGLEAFKGCGNLHALECKAVNPPSAYANSFDEMTYKTCVLSVPDEAVKAYGNNSVWGNFNIGSLFVAVTSIELSPDIWEAREGETVQISATIYPENATEKTLLWESSEEKVATVDENGFVTILSSGSCKITAYAIDGSGISATCELQIVSDVDEIVSGDSSSISIFTLSGTSVLLNGSKEDIKNLTPGIYIVRQGAKTTKISVK